jgi:hypothetical protein
MRARLLAAAGTAALALAGSVMAASPALAAPCATPGCTDVTFTLTAAGGLSITVPDTSSTPVALGTTAAGTTTITHQLGAVAVTDLRGALGASWTATVSSTDFKTGGGSANETIANSLVNYWSGSSTATSGTAVLAPGQATSLLAQALSTSRTAFAASATVGNNSATWNPTLVVNVPAQAVVGTYAGVVTHSVA